MASHDIEEKRKIQCLELLKAFLSLTSPDYQVQEKGGGGAAKQQQEGGNDKDRSELLKKLSEHQVEGKTGNIVPKGLPASLRANAENIQPEDISKLYDIDSGVQRVEKGELSAVDLVTLHLKSYRNILDIELSDMDVFRHRFVRYFNEVFTEVIERCFKDREMDEVVGVACWVWLVNISSTLKQKQVY